MSDSTRLIWCTDIHLDHCNNIPMFIDDVITMKPDAILLTGDNSNSLQIEKHLTIMAEQWDVPIYFVLGNHDYYGANVYVPAKMNETRKKVQKITDQFDNLTWLETSGYVKLTDSTALVGSSLWCDWRAGFGDKSSVWLNDYLLISDLFGMPQSFSDRNKIKKKVRKLAKDHTKQLMTDFQKAVDDGFKKVIVGVHVPPFHEASFHAGKVQDDDWAPHFVCQIAGEELLAACKKHVDVDVTVLFGHTHGSTKKDLLSNLHAINGGSVYRHPAPQIPIILD